MANKLAILGAGGHGKVVADAALAGNEWSNIFFFDDAYPNKQNIGRWLICGDSKDLRDNIGNFDGVIVAIGENRLRLVKSIELESIGAVLVSIVHPDALISRFVSLGAGSVILGKAIINVDTTIGKACIINSGAIVEHDCKLHDGVHISPGAALAGQTEIGTCSWVGIGAITRQLSVIGLDATVGAGAVVLNSVPDFATVVGNPAKKLK